MSSQNRFLLPHNSLPGCGVTTSTPGTSASGAVATTSSLSDHENPLSVDTDFDSYWEEEARNPHRNRIRIGRQYQATVPPLLKAGDSDQRKLADLETLTFCPKLSAKVSNAELDHYFTVAKSLNLFASLVETRSLLGRDVTIADLNHIRHKEGLSLASVIQPTRQSANYGHSPQSSQQQASVNVASTSKTSPLKSPQSILQQQDNKPSTFTSASSPSEATSQNANTETCTFNQPLMRALSHFISLHHPCHHDQDCKKLNKELPIEDDLAPAVSITAGNLRQMSSSSSGSSAKGRSRSSLKQTAKQFEETTENNSNPDQDQVNSDNASQSASFDDWTREEIELFSKAIEICGKNFGSIKKEFLPSKSVRSIVEYYYIGSRDASDSKKKQSQSAETADSCNSSEKSQSNSSEGGGGSDGVGDANGPSSSSPSSRGNNSTSSSRLFSNPENETRAPNESQSDSDKLMSSSIQKASLGAKTKLESLNNYIPTKDNSTPAKLKTTPKNIDARMSVYNFDDEFKDDGPVQLTCPPRPGAEVKPLKAKPIVPNAAFDSEAGNSNVGSLKFFMDGQLVLKLNACQDQQEGADKCHWVQSGEKALSQGRQKRYNKRANSDNLASLKQSLNGSYSNSVSTSNNDEDSKNEDLSLDEEDSKESANSSSTVSTPQRPKKQSTTSTTPKRSKAGKIGEATSNLNNQAPSPIDYNRLAINNRMKERNDNPTSQSPVGAATSSLINQAAANAAASMPNWLQANQFAMAAAILGGLPFPATAAAAAAGNMLQNMSNNSNNGVNHLQHSTNNNMALNMTSSKPMDLSLEHNAPKPIISKPSSRSRSKQKN